MFGTLKTKSYLNMIATINIHAYMYVSQSQEGNIQTLTLIVLKTWSRLDFLIFQTFHRFNFEKANTLLLKKLNTNYPKEDSKKIAFSNSDDLSSCKFLTVTLKKLSLYLICRLFQFN